MVTRKFKYAGESRNLGKHGFVNTGDILTMTFKEAISVSDNPLFEPVQEDEAGEESFEVSTEKTGEDEQVQEEAATEAEEEGAEPEKEVATKKKRGR